MKSLRQRLQERGLLESYLKQHPYNLAAKYFPGIAVEPLENYMDVRGWDWELGSRSTGEHGSFPIQLACYPSHSSLPHPFNSSH